MDLQIKKEYMVFDITKAVTRDGRPFLKMVLADKSGKLINSIMFDSNKLDFEPQKGDTVSVGAMLQQYNNQNQLKVNDMSFISSGGAEAFLPKSQNDPKQMQDELKHVLEKHITDVNFKSLVKAFYMDKDTFNCFVNAPAARTVHHAYIHGLLEHTLGVVKAAVNLSALYPGLNKELLIVGGLFHDIGKVRELDSSAGFEYTDAGRLFGHIMIGYSMVENYIDTVEGFPESLKKQLLHIIASHHGTLEFGSPTLPKTAEAVAVNHLDDLDAKLNNFESILAKDEVKAGGWSNYDRLLERQVYRPEEV